MHYVQDEFRVECNNYITCISVVIVEIALFVLVNCALCHLMHLCLLD